MERIFSLRLLLASLAGLLLSAILLSVTAAGVFRESAPQLALRLAPYDARARAAAAQQALSSGLQPSGALLDQMDVEARDAYRRDATALAGVRIAGLIADLRQRHAAARRMFAYAEALSRRDMATQLWLIEERVQANDMDGALRHYDTIMRSSDEVKPILYPILTQATESPEIAVRVNRILREKPNWWRNFLTYFLGASNNPEALATVFRRTLDWSDSEDRELALPLVSRLAGAHRFDLAWNAYVDLRGAEAGSPALLRDGNFRNDRPLPPFDWAYATDGDLSPDRRLRENSARDFALYVPTASQVAGDVAKQLIRSPPGRYRIEALVGDVPDDPARRPLIRVSCADQGEHILGSADFPAAPAGGRRMVLDFTVPAGCADQWVAIRVKGTLDQAERGWAWISALSMRRS